MLSHVQLCDTMDCSLPVSPVLGILQAGILEWVANSSSRGYPGIEPTSPTLAGGFFTTSISWEALLEGTLFLLIYIETMT